MVFAQNNYDMSVGIVNITQRKYYKDTLHLLHHRLLQLLRERQSYIYPALLYKEKWLLGNKVKKCD